MKPFTPLNGQTFGRLTVDQMTPPKPVASGKNRHPMIECICSCQENQTDPEYEVQTFLARADALTSGNTLSCGCLAKEVHAAQRSNPAHAAALIEWAKQTRAFIRQRHATTRKV